MAVPATQLVVRVGPVVAGVAGATVAATSAATMLFAGGVFLVLGAFAYSIWKAAQDPPTAPAPSRLGNGRDQNEGGAAGDADDGRPAEENRPK